MSDKAIAKAVKTAGALIAIPILTLAEIGSAIFGIGGNIITSIAYVLSSEDDEKYAKEIREILDK